MTKVKPLFKKGSIFFHEDQKLFVSVENVDFITNKGNLYTLKVYAHKDKPSEYKRYYEDKVIDLLTPMKKTNAVKVLFGSK